MAVFPLAPDIGRGHDHEPSGVEDRLVAVFASPLVEGLDVRARSCEVARHLQSLADLDDLNILVVDEVRLRAVFVLKAERGALPGGAIWCGYLDDLDVQIILPTDGDYPGARQRPRQFGICLCLCLRFLFTFVKHQLLLGGIILSIRGRSAHACVSWTPDVS